MNQRSVTLYRREQDTTLVEIELDRVEELFNSFDPSPFLRRDLDEEAERYLVGAFQEFPQKAPLKIVVHVPATVAITSEALNLPESVRNYFQYRARVAASELRQLFRQGRLMLVIGLTFLFVCISARQAVATLGTTTAIEILSEGLSISGWVSMWGPLHVFLFDWWPIRRRQRILEKIALAPLEVRGRREPGATRATPGRSTVG